LCQEFLHGGGWAAATSSRLSHRMRTKSVPVVDG
jgi:hypothetical protein